MMRSADDSRDTLVRRAAWRLSPLLPRRFVRDLSLQTTSNYLSTALQLARGLVLARLLGPASLGVYAAVGLVIAYSAFANLGMGGVALREIPIALGGGQNQEAEAWRWYALATSTACSILAAVCLAGYVLLRWGSLQPDLRFGLLTGCFVLVSSALSSQQLAILRAQQHFGRLTAILVSTAAVSLIAGIAGALLAGVRGVFVGQVIASAIAAGVSLHLAGLPRPLPIHAAFLRRLLKAGSVFALIDLASYSLINVDQVMIVALLGSSALGTYMPVLYAGSAVALFPNAVVIAVGSRLLRRYGEESTTQAVDSLTWRPVQGLSLVMPMLCALAWALGPLAIEWILPAYVSAIGPLRVYVVGVFFLGLNMGTSSALFALNKHKYYVPIVFGCVALNVCLDLAFVAWLGWSLVGIALGSVLTYVTYWMVHTTLIRYYFGIRLRRAVVLNLISGWPGFALAAATVVAWVTGNLWGPSYWFGSLLLAVTVGITVVRWKAAGPWAPRLLGGESRGAGGA